MGKNRACVLALCVVMILACVGILSSCAPKQIAPLEAPLPSENQAIGLVEEGDSSFETEPALDKEITETVSEKEEKDLSKHDFEPALDAKDGTFLSQIFEYDKLDINSLLESKSIPITRGKEHPWLDYLTVRTNQEQFDFLKAEGVEIERKYVWGDREQDTSKPRVDKTRPFERDPYQKLKEQYEGSGYRYLRRLYLDITGEGIPELFIMTYEGTGGSSYLVYQIEPDGYLFVGEMHFRGLAVLRTKTNGFHDLIHVWRRGDGEGSLTLMQFDGYEYKEQRGMWVPINEVYSEFLRSDHPDLLKKDYSTEDLGESFHWTPRDDDKFRWK